ncbi:MAG: Gfo/Idh/MocA family oxidoreductase [Prolixibacteraceae bacterium]|jgi:predicted dehydrogenase|nr:Gfo/Idh/MocA family oxidoreductase [Prolixibacteraceae bacterium]MBT6763890.1 Gfo/Idh/MocA family oxidoreductase [Prolixibacteraceae bacterium]MBT7000605.1 Gfo/Idh/MocA family oxidoreductase [Prolixibacteraceae bacterium]MBT7396981.1 Gfo/Idh/MocA family oxidoreductase [Prolixibacteraceae bacterium]
MDKNQSRRKFIKNSATATAAALTIPTIVPAQAFGANDRINAAVLGLNGRGKSHIQGFMAQDNVEITHLCDPDMNILKERQKQFKEKYDKDIALEQDLRKIYDNKDIDVVSIASPNHWHALSVIWACQAGKDVYVEKPGSHNIWEGRKMVEAASKYDRIVQHGVQLRSSPSVREAVQMMHDGYIGRVYMARGLVFRWRDDIGRKGFSPVPEGLDYDLWTGPATKQPFSRDIVHYNWHWTFEYGNGDVGNQGIHETDLCMWGLDVGLPTKITSMGGKFLWDDAKVTPEVLTSIYNYPEENKIIQFEVRPWCTNTEEGATVGNIFYGDKGILVVDGYDKYQFYMGRNREPGKAGDDGQISGTEMDRGAGGTDGHFTNFIDAVRAHDKTILNGPVETAHLSSGLAHLGNIAYRLGKVLTFNPDTEKFVNDSEADKMLTRNYRAPYVVPEKV